MKDACRRLFLLADFEAEQPEGTSAVTIVQNLVSRVYYLVIMNTYIGINY